MNKYNGGDKVQVINDCGAGEFEGKNGVVTMVHERTGYYEYVVWMDDGTASEGLLFSEGALIPRPKTSALITHVDSVDADIRRMIDLAADITDYGFSDLAKELDKHATMLLRFRNGFANAMKEDGLNK